MRLFNMSRIIYIEFTRPSKKLFPFFSWGIRAVENTTYSHVRLRWINSWGAEMVYEASGTTVKFIGPVALEDLHVKVLHSYKLELTDEQYKQLLQLCIENAGVNYGYKQIFGILLVKLFRLKKNPLSEGRKSQVCSEIVGRFLQEVLDIGQDLELDIAGPKAIQLTLENNPSVWRK